VASSVASEHVGVDLVVGKQRAFIQMPLVLVEVIKDVLEHLIGNLDFIALTFCNVMPLKHAAIG
jgi:hypothetical protein